MNGQGEVHADAAWTRPVAIPSASAVLSTVAGTVTRGRVVTREAGRLARELLRISWGSSSVAPAKGDWRFTDPTWNENPLYRRIGQAYLSFTESMDRLVDEAEKSGRDADKARFAVTLLTSAVAPTNFWLGNPAAIKRTVETGGRNLTRGVRNWAGDLRHNVERGPGVELQAIPEVRDLRGIPRRGSSGRLYRSQFSRGVDRDTKHVLEHARRGGLLAVQLQSCSWTQG